MMPQWWRKTRNHHQYLSQLLNTPLLKLLEELAADKYTVKSLHGDMVKMQSLTAHEYSIIIKILEENETEYQTYQTKPAKLLRVVLKNLHPFIQKDKIKNSLKDLCHEVVHVWNVKQRKTNAPLPMFFLDLKPSDNNKKIYNGRRLLNVVVRVEAPYSTRQEIPQFDSDMDIPKIFARCVKCAREHLNKDHAKKESDINVLCANCMRIVQKITKYAPSSKNFFRRISRRHLVTKQDIAPCN